ncbi:MAG: hypothetical protein MZV63_27285 [Marinilabiliales bacterium]|nr:hypothetical protein [Marinilabiliales bacterium]
MSAISPSAYAHLYDIDRRGVSRAVMDQHISLSACSVASSRGTGKDRNYRTVWAAHSRIRADNTFSQQECRCLHRPEC